MGMPQPGSPEASENAVSEGHDRSQRTSMESPKAAQPSCLRGGFICLFLKRTERNGSLEDASSSNQSTEDKHGVRGKKRKVLSGNIFRLPCLRPAESTETGDQINAQVNKVDEQGNQATPEEELKPYSKASFLRKIRGYRLMRERDASEKEKVIEMEQCKEGSFVEEHHENKLELGGKVTEPKIYEDTLGEKRKMSGAKESEEMMNGNKGSNVLQQERKAELSADQADRENNDKNLRDPEKTVDERDNGGRNIGVKRNGNVEELGNYLEDKDNQAGKANGHGDKDILGQESHKEIVEDMDNKDTKQKQTKGIPEPGDSIKNQEINSERVHELDNDLPEHNQFIHTKKADDVTNFLPKNDMTMENAEKLENDLQEQKSPEENTGDMAKISPKQDENERRERSEFSEHKKDGEEMPIIIDQESHAEIAEDTQKKQDKVEELVENFPKNKTHEEVVGELNSHLLDRDSYKEKRDHLIVKEIHVNNVEEPENLALKQNILIENIGRADHSTELNSHTQKEGKTMDQFPDQASHTQKEENAGDHLLEQSSNIQKEGKTRDHLLEQHSHIHKEEKTDDQFIEEDCHKHKDRKTKDQLLEEDCHKHKEEIADDQFIEEDCHKHKDGKTEDQLLEEDCHKPKDGKPEDQFVEEDCHKHKDRKAQDQCLEENGHKYKTGKAEDQFLEEGCQKHKNDKAEDHFLEENCHKQKDGKSEGQFLEEKCQKHKDGEAKDHFPEKDYHKHKDRNTEDHLLEEDYHKLKERKTEDQFLVEDKNIMKYGKAGDQFVEEDCHKHIDRKAQDQCLEENCHKHKNGKAEDQFLEEGCQKHKDGEAKDHFLEEDCHKHKDRKEDHLLEEDYHTQKERKSEDQFLEEDNHIMKEGKAGDRFLEQDGPLQKGDCLLEQNSNTENTREPDTLCLEQKGHENNLGKTKAQITEQDSLEEGEGTLPKEKKCVKKHKGQGKVFSEEIKDRSVKQEILITHTTCMARSGEPHTEFSTLQEESAPKTVDFNYYHQDSNQEDINDGDDDGMEDAEWKSLQVEVKSMVQWLVEEASDRLESFPQESQGTE